MGQTISAYIQDDDLVSWLRDKKKSGQYRSLGHGVEEGLRLLREREDADYAY